MTRLPAKGNMKVDTSHDLKAKLHRPMQRTLIILFFVTSLSAAGQLNTKIYVDGVLTQEDSFSDTLTMTKYLNDLQWQWVNDGYYFSGMDSTKQEGDLTHVFLHRGSKSKTDIDGLKGKRLLVKIKKKVAYYSNHGYPFAKATLKNSSFKSDHLIGDFLIERGPEITYDSASFISEIKTQPSYLYRLLDIVPGDHFNQDQYETISKKISRSPYYSLKRPVDISFRKNRANVYLDLEEVQTNSFQGVAGLQQSGSGKSQLVGSLDLNIQNLFRSGKMLRFFWERFGEQSQRLSLAYKHPFVLGSRISPSVSFDLLKQDSVFLTRKTDLGLSAFVSSTVSLFLGYQQMNGTLLESDVARISNSGLADYKRRVYRLEISDGFKESLSTLRNGFVWQLNAGVGNKEVEKNSSIDDSYYDTISLETNFYQFDFELAYQSRIGKRQAVYHATSAGILQNDELLTNELYRIGGLSTLRGFNEKNFFAEKYFLSRVELRSFFENSSYVYLFYDQLIYSQVNLSETPFGVGLGFVLETSSGQFSFALANGKSNDQSFGFSNMKIHFGYISRF